MITEKMHPQNNRLVKVVLLSLLFSGFLASTSCRTVSDESVQEEPEEMTTILQRPGFQMKFQDPLMDLSFNWTLVDRAAGYELQQSQDSGFLTISKSWTLKKNHYILIGGVNPPSYFRVRAFNNKQTSNWSETKIINHP